MIRRAVVVGIVNTLGNAALPGAGQDAVRMDAFLRSIPGGAWEASEIRARLDPNRATLQSDILWASGADYSLVLFSGHGGVRYQNVPGVGQVPFTFMTCADGREVSHLDLRPESDRILMVLDCCRGVIEPMKKAAEALGEVAKAMRTPITRELARKLFDRAVLAAEKGTIIIHGCDLNESAADKISFTHVLIGVTEAWAAEGSGIAPTGEAFKFARTRLSSINRDQHPQIDMGRRQRDFPFGVGEWLERELLFS